MPSGIVQPPLTASELKIKTFKALWVHLTEPNVAQAEEVVLERKDWPKVIEISVIYCCVTNYPKVWWLRSITISLFPTTVNRNPIRTRLVASFAPHGASTWSQLRSFKRYSFGFTYMLQGLAEMARKLASFGPLLPDRQSQCDLSSRVHGGSGLKEKMLPGDRKWKLTIS